MGTKTTANQKNIVTYKLLAIVIGKEFLQLEVPVMATFKDAIWQQRLAHVASPGVLITSIVRRSGVNQDVQAVHAETPGPG